MSRRYSRLVGSRSMRRVWIASAASAASDASGQLLQLHVGARDLRVGEGEVVLRFDVVGVGGGERAQDR